MKPKTVIVLAVLLCGVIGYVVVRHSGLFGADTSQPGLVFGRALDSIGAIRFTNSDGEEMSFTREGDGWLMTQPARASANDRDIDMLARSLEGLKFAQAYGPADAPGASLTGLDAPLWEIAFSARGKAYVLQVGKRTPLLGGQQLTYVHAGTPGDMDDRVFAVEADFDTFLRRPVADFRDRVLLAVDPERVIGLTVEGTDSFSVSRDGDHWRIKTARFEALADGELVARVLTSYQGIGVEDFGDDAPNSLTPYGLDADGLRLKITLTLEDPDQTHVLILGATAGEQVYAKLADQPGVVLVASALLTRLQPDPKLLRDAHITSLGPEDIVEFRLARPADTMMARRGADGKWLLVEPLEGAANGPAVEQLLMRLLSIQADAFHDGPVAATTLGLEEPFAQLELKSKDGRTETIRFAHAKGDEASLFAQTAEPSPVLALPSHEADTLSADLIFFCDRTLSRMPLGTRVTGLVLRRHMDAADETLTIERNDQGDWIIAGPQPTAANNEIIERLVQQLRNLQAVEITSISETAPEAFEWANRWVLATVIGETADNGPSETVLRFVSPNPTSDPAGAFAWSPRRRPVVIGRVAPALFEDLTGDLRSTLIWQFEPAAIRRISIRSGGATPMVLVQTDGKWAVEGDNLTDIDDRVVADYLAGISYLQANRFVPDSIGRERAFGLDKPWLTVELTAADGSAHRIVVGPRGPEQQPHRYGIVDGIESVLVLPAGAIAKLTRSVDDFLRN